MTPAKRSPDGYVAQRMPVSINGHGHWVLTRMNANGWALDMQVLDDERVADWPALCDEAAS